MGIFDSIGSLLNGTLRTGGKVVDTAVNTAKLDGESAFISAGDTVESAVDTAAETIDSLFEW